jgi:hypothetical protein
MALISAGGDAAEAANSDLFKEYPETWARLYGGKTDREEPNHF